MKANTKYKPRLREVPKPTTRVVALPPGLPDEELPNVYAAEVNDSANAPTAQQGDICVVWMGHPFESGDFGAVETADGVVCLGTLRHGPGGYVTLTTGERGDRSHTFKPGEYRQTGRAFSVERERKVVKRFPL